MGKKKSKKQVFVSLVFAGFRSAPLTKLSFFRSSSHGAGIANGSLKMRRVSDGVRICDARLTMHTVAVQSCCNIKKQSTSNATIVLES